MQQSKSVGLLSLALSALTASALLLSSLKAGAQEDDPGGGPPGDNPSGLPWKSGVTGPITWGAWRGRPIDIRTQFLGRTTWAHMLASVRARPDTPHMALGFPMLPESHRGQLAQCGDGAFDVQMQQIVDRMVQNGWANRTYIRLGWEMTRTDRSPFPWVVQGDGSTWKECWQRWVNIFNPVQDDVRQRRFFMVFNVANVGTFPYPIDRLYPGRDTVDVIGSQYYDRCPPIRDEVEWNRREDTVDRWGNPAGPGGWLNYARSKGKPWALPEWGVGGPRNICAEPGIDNPFFIRKVFQFLSANADDIAFDSYFNASGGNGPGSHQLLPEHFNPLSAAEYRRIW